MALEGNNLSVICKKIVPVDIKFKYYKPNSIFDLNTIFSIKLYHDQVIVRNIVSYC